MQWTAKENNGWYRSWAWLPARVTVAGKLTWVWMEWLEERSNFGGVEVRVPS